MSRDNRVYDRFEVLEYVLLLAEDNQRPLRCIIVDISLGGVQLQSKEPLPVGIMCQLRIGSDKEYPFELRGEVRYSRKVPGTELYASGFRFMPDTHEQRAAVARYVHGVFAGNSEQIAG
jgi:c-di-GMP-binding flagellar brake protein YcgR